jgi:hypothetical protein
MARCGEVVLTTRSLLSGKSVLLKERLAGLYARQRGKIVSEQIIALEARISEGD